MHNTMQASRRLAPLGGFATHRKVPRRGNVFVKPKEQSEACFNYALARKHLYLYELHKTVKNLDEKVKSFDTGFLAK